MAQAPLFANIVGQVRRTKRLHISIKSSCCSVCVIQSYCPQNQPADLPLFYWRPVPTRLLSVPGYKLYRADRPPDSRLAAGHGGVAILARDNVEVTVLPRPSTETQRQSNLEIIWARMQIGKERRRDAGTSLKLWGQGSWLWWRPIPGTTPRYPKLYFLFGFRPLHFSKCRIT